jgi:hypothetical protein
VTVILGAIVAVAAFVVFMRGQTTTEVSPHDQKVFEARYAARGVKVVAIRRIGTDANTFDVRQRPPIRKYEIDTEDPSGRRQTRVRGISRGQWDRDVIWRLAPRGGWERLDG